MLDGHGDPLFDKYREVGHQEVISARAFDSGRIPRRSEVTYMPD